MFVTSKNLWNLTKKTFSAPVLKTYFEWDLIQCIIICDYLFLTNAFFNVISKKKKNSTLTTLTYLWSKFSHSNVFYLSVCFCKQCFLVFSTIQGENSNYFLNISTMTHLYAGRKKKKLRGWRSQNSFFVCVCVEFITSGLHSDMFWRYYFCTGPSMPHKKK